MAMRQAFSRPNSGTGKRWRRVIKKPENDGLLWGFGTFHREKNQGLVGCLEPSREKCWVL
jgi:hypothetical protein